MSNLQDFKVAISMVTYNHENFIDEAILGVLNQKTDFEFVLVLSDDSSPDKTPEICREFARKYPNKIIYKEFNNNVGMVGNWKWNMERCFEFQTEYIAICEGDDIWTDPLKLQKQADILDAKPEYSMVCGAVNIIDEKSEFVRERFSFEKDFDIDSNYILHNNHITTCTVMMRKDSLDLNVIVPGINFLDKFLWLSLLSKGSCYFINDTLASYRIHSGGTYSKLKVYQKSLNRLQDYSKMKRIFPDLKKTLSRRIKINIFTGFLSSVRHGQLVKSVHILSFLYK